VEVSAEAKKVATEVVVVVVSVKKVEMMTQIALVPSLV
jgi:hypothetical protein